MLRLVGKWGQVLNCDVDRSPCPRLRRTADLRGGLHPAAQRLEDLGAVVLGEIDHAGLERSDQASYSVGRALRLPVLADARGARGQGDVAGGSQVLSFETSPLGYLRQHPRPDLLPIVKGEGKRRPALALQESVEPFDLACTQPMRRRAA